MGINAPFIFLIKSSYYTAGGIVNSGYLPSLRKFGDCLNGVFITPNYQTYNDVAKHIVKKWMDSPPHKKILMGDYKECGTHIGIYEKSEITSTRSTYITFSVVW